MSETYSDVTNEQLHATIDALTAAADTAHPIPSDDPAVAVAIAACEETLYYRSFGTPMTAVQDWLNRNLAFLRMLADVPGYSEQRPQIGLVTDEIQAYLAGLEVFEPK